VSEPTTAAVPSPVNTAPQPPADAPEWRSSLPADLRAHPALQHVKDVAGLAKEHVNLQGLIGRKGIIPPSDRDGPEQWEKFYTALGRPAAPDGYAFRKPDGFAAYNDELAAWFKQTAHKAGLPAKAAAALHDAFVTRAMEGARHAGIAREQATQDIETELQGEWGGSYDRKLELARRAARAYGDETTLSALEEKIGGAEMIRMFARIGENAAEDTLAGEARRSFAPGTDEAKSEIRRLQGEAFRDPSHPLMDKLHPEHQALVRKMNQLYAAAYGR
jgi:hypothetical protein